MFLKKKWFAILLTIIVILILTACGTNGDKVDVESENATDIQKSLSFDFMPLSDAIEKYSLWFKVEGDPFELTRNSKLEDIFVFDNGKVKKHRARWAKLKVEDLVDMSDDEIIKVVIDSLYEHNEDYEEPESIEYTLDITLDDLRKDS